MSDFLRRWPALIIGLALGLALGLVYTWGIDPVDLTNTYPALLRTDYRWDWVRLMALSYVADGDLARARARLNGLKHEDVAGAVSALIEEYAATGRSADTMRSLTALAQALDVYTPVMIVYLRAPTVLPQSPTHTPTPLVEEGKRTSTPSLVPSPTREVSPLSTPTPEPALTPTPYPLTPTPLPTPPFRLTQQEQVCEAGQTPHIEVIVQDERGAGLAGMEIWLMWPGGADRAVTGLKPQHGAGYADFNAELHESYALGLGELGMSLVTDLQIKPCPAEQGQEPLLGSWRIVLQPQPPATAEP